MHALLIATTRDQVLDPSKIMGEPYHFALLEIASLIEQWMDGPNGKLDCRE